MEIWINPRCSKCRIAQETLDAAGAEYTVRRYLDDPPTAQELRDILQRLTFPRHARRPGQIDQPVRGHVFVGFQQQHGEDEPLLANAEVDGLPVDGRPHRPEH